MDITYLGHSAFRIRTRSGSLVTDPFDSEMVGFKFPKVSAEIVTISHNHDDHNKSDSVSDVKKIITGPGEYEISGVTIIGISTFHDDKKGALRGKNTIYIIENEDLRVVHLGDLGHKIPEETLEEIGNVDVLMIPVGGVYTIAAPVAAEIAREIEAAITIPMHYQQMGLDAKSFGQLSSPEDFLEEVGLPVEKLDKLSIKKSDLIEQQKVVVLERKT